jgi:site-specific DNA-cytosine methylase
MSCGQIALMQLGFKIDKYFASEIKKIAIKVTKYNYPDTIHIGDVTKVSFKDGILYTENGNYEVGHIDLLCGGSPCQDLSGMNKKQVGLAGAKSSLFWEYARIKKEVNPTYFLLENVGSMPYADAMEITKEMGVDVVRINSSLVSAQQRDRIYWTNIPGSGTYLFGGGQIEQPEDKKIMLKDILESGYTNKNKSVALLARSYWATCPTDPYKLKRYLFKRQKKGFVNVKWKNKDMTEDNVLMLSQTELERLQTVPEGYTNCLTHREASNVLGDGWTVEVIKHIFKGIKL